MGLDLLVGLNRVAIGPGSVVNGVKYELVGGRSLVSIAELPVIRNALLNILTEQTETRTRMESVVVGELPEDRKVESAKHGHGGQTVAGFAIKKIRSLSGGRHEVPYTEGITAAFAALLAQHEGRRDRTPRQCLVFPVDPQTGRAGVQDAG